MLETLNRIFRLIEPDLARREARFRSLDNFRWYMVRVLAREDTPKNRQIYARAFHRAQEYLNRHLHHLLMVNAQYFA